jgi:hypothetical protein
MVAVVAAVVVVRARVGRRSDEAGKEVVTRIDECRSACKVVDV